MKKSTGFSLITLFIIFSVSCSKKNEVQTVQTIRIQVVEYKTNIPVQGALVEYYTPCNSCIPSPGYNLVFSQHTTAGGFCDIPETIFNTEHYGILITPPPPPQNPQIDYYYWPTGSPAVHSTARKYELPVTGDAKLHLIKINDFPNGYYLELKARGEKPSFQELYISTVNPLPSDSSFVFYTYRGQTNTITWNIYDSTGAIVANGGSLTVDIPKTGTTEIELKY
jgi:hypothetical protein